MGKEQWGKSKNPGRGAASYLQGLQFPPKLYKRVGQDLLSQDCYRQGTRALLSRVQKDLRTKQSQPETLERRKGSG